MMPTTRITRHWIGLVIKIELLHYPADWVASIKAAVRVLAASVNMGFYEFKFADSKILQIAFFIKKGPVCRAERTAKLIVCVKLLGSAKIWINQRDENLSPLVINYWLQQASPYFWRKGAHRGNEIINNNEKNGISFCVIVF